MIETAKRELKEMLYNLIVGINEWENDYSRVPDLLYQGHMLFIKNAASSGGKVHNNLYDLMNVLKKPAKEWGINGVEDFYSPDAALIEEAIGLTPEAENFLDDYEYPLEDDQRAMRNVLSYCREHGLEIEYRMIRIFLSNPAHAVISHENLNFFLRSKLNDDKLRKLVENCFQPIPHSLSQYRKCPHCGWTLEFRKGFWRCNKEEVCSYLEDFSMVSKSEFEKENDLIRQIPGIQRFTLLPGIHELELAQQLEEKGYEVELYPEIDQFDLRVSIEDQIIDVDVKDYKDPRQLANHFNQLSKEGIAKYHKKSYIVIPDYRTQISPAYIDLFKSRIKDEVNITLLKSRDFVRELKEGKL